MNEIACRISRYYTMFMEGITVVAMIMFNLSPTINNARKTIFAENRDANYTLELSLYYSFPGFNPHEHFKLVTVYNVYLSYNCGILICGIDLLLFLMIFQIIGHVNVLRLNLSNFESPNSKITLKVRGTSSDAEPCTVEIYDQEENRIAHTKLADCIEHHKIIIEFTDEISQLFGPMLAFNYLFHLVGCCLLLLECSEGGADSVLRYGPLTTVIFGQLIQMSVIFEILGSETEKLKESAYLVPWQCMNVSNQRSVCFLLHRMQDKISLTALGLTAVGVDTMTWILKTTFSYFAFLRSIDN
uniref:Odorant receptor n=1 Tax=Leucinodes orbonalis TaxID=711050 RepID=A0AAU0QLP5_9NEOP|nr:odorant receptor [Leucinodes orbonalis]